MTLTPSSEREALSAADLTHEEDGLDPALLEDVPSADDSSSRVAARDGDGVGFTLDDFAALLSKYDYNFKPGDVVNGTVFALESKEIGRAHV